MNAVMAGWEKSPGHYQNMIKPDFTHVAFGSASAASSLNGTYWVQNFGWGTVGDDLRRGAMRPQGAREEVACRGDIPAAGDMHVVDLAMLVHRPVHVPPHSGHLHVGLIGEQAISDRVQGLHTVGLTGLEPAAFRPPAGRATKLRHSPRSRTLQAPTCALHRRDRFSRTRITMRIGVPAKPKSSRSRRSIKRR